MVTAAEFVALARSQEGDRYIFGHEVSPSDSDPSAFDCSELIEWVGARLGVTPRIPDGSWNQYRHSAAHGLTIPVADAYSVRGALLFIFRDKNGRPVDPGIARPAQSHVAISLGDGRTIEARGAAYGVGVFTAIGRGWTHASLIPGVDYSTGHETPDEEGETMRVREFVLGMQAHPERIDRLVDAGVIGPRKQATKDYWKGLLADPDHPAWLNFVNAFEVQTALNIAKAASLSIPAGSGGVVQLKPEDVEAIQNGVVSEFARRLAG